MHPAHDSRNGGWLRGLFGKKATTTRSGGQNKKCYFFVAVALLLQAPILLTVLHGAYNDESQAAASCPGKIPIGARLPQVDAATGPRLPAMWRDSNVRPKNTSAGTNHKLRHAFVLTGGDAYMPASIHANLQALMDANPDYALEYFNEQSARKYLQREATLKVLSTFEMLPSSLDRRRFFAMYYIHTRGGFVIDPRLTQWSLDSSLQAHDGTILVWLGPEQQFSTSFIGSVGGAEPGFMSALIDEIIVRAHHDAVKNRARGPIVNGHLMADVFQRLYEFRADGPARTRGAHVVKLERLPQCYAWSGRSADAMNLFELGCNLQCQAAFDSMAALEEAEQAEQLRAGGGAAGSQGAPARAHCPVSSERSKELVPVASAAAKIHFKSHSEVTPTFLHALPQAAVPRPVLRAIESQVEENPSFRHRVFTLEHMADFMSFVPDPRVFIAFNALAFASDKTALFLLAHLSKYGGVVTPATGVAVSSLEAVLPSDRRVKVVFASHAPPTNRSHTAKPAPWFIAAAPDSALLSLALDMAVKRILDREHSIDSERVVGPALLQDALQRHIEKHGEATDVAWLPLAAGGGCGSERLVVPQDSSKTVMHMRYQHAAAEEWFFDHRDAAVKNIYVEDPVSAVNHKCPLGLPRHHATVAAAANSTAAADANDMRVLRPLHVPSVPEPEGHVRMARRFVSMVPSLRVTKRVYDGMMSLIRVNPDFELRVFDEQSAEVYVVSRCDGKPRRAYSAAKSFALRRDLFAYCFLKMEGGIYVDAGTTAVKSIYSIVTPGFDFTAAAWNSGELYVGFIAVVERHPIIREALSMASDRVLSRNPRRLSQITGGGTFAAAFQTVVQTAPAPWTHIGGVKVSAVGYDEECAMGTVYLDQFHALITPVIGPDPANPSHVDRDSRHVLSSDLFRDALDGSNGCPFGMNSGAMISQDEGDDRSVFAVPEDRAIPKLSSSIAAASDDAMLPRKNLKIPRRIMQTNKVGLVPRGLRAAMQSIVDTNPDFGYEFYSDERINDFMLAHVDVRVYEAFNTLIPGAFRSDLFRYCYLYQFGGVYVDGDMSALAQLNDLLNETDEFVSADDNNIGWLYNAFIATVPRHPIIAAAINMSVDRILRRDYGPHTLSITGPLLLSNAFEATVGVKPSRFSTYLGGKVRNLGYGRHEHCGSGYIRDAVDGRPYFVSGYPEYRAEMKWYHAQTPYWELWMGRRVFADIHSKCPTVAPPTTAATVPKDVAAYRPAVAQPVNESANFIPRRIIQTGESDTVDWDRHTAMLSIARYNKDCDIEYFSAHRMREYVLHHCNVSDQHDHDPIAEADFRVLRRTFVYCDLWLRGGVYIDSRFIALSSVSALLAEAQPDDIFAAMAPHSVKSRPEAVDTFIAVPPGHPMMAAALRGLRTIAAQKAPADHVAFAGAAAGHVDRLLLLSTATKEKCHMAHMLSPKRRPMFWVPLAPPAPSTAAAAPQRGALGNEGQHLTLSAAAGDGGAS